MAIVVPKDDKQLGVTIKDESSFYPKEVHLCNHSSPQQNTPCNNQGVTATKQYSCVHLTSQAYAGVNYDEIALKDQKLYFENDPYYHDIDKHMQPGVKNMVAMTDKLERSWSKSASTTMEVFWKYVATYNGVLRVYPSPSISHELEYMDMDWFSKCVNNAEDVDVILSTPRYDHFTGNNVVISVFTNLIQTGQK